MYEADIQNKIEWEFFDTYHDKKKIKQQAMTMTTEILLYYSQQQSNRRKYLAIVHGRQKAT